MIEVLGRRVKIIGLGKHKGDFVFFVVLSLAALVLPAVIGLIFLFLTKNSWVTVQSFGFGFVTSSVWDPVQDVYGALPVIFGTLVSSFLAILISAPISVGVALLLTEIAPKRVATIVGFLVEMLAAIPSVVYGLWGIFVLAPWLRDHVQPFLGKHLGFLPLFQGTPYGVGMMAAAIILAIMITPTVTSVSREIFKSIPQLQREAALTLGATRWETIRMAVLNSARSGIFGAVILGLGRALGETMAVTMVIGNRAEISWSLFDPAQTMASVLANQYAEATTDLHISALVEIGLVLFAVTFVINALARVWAWKIGQDSKK